MLRIDNCSASQQRTVTHDPPPPCISYANVHNYYGSYAYCSLDKGVACAQHIQLLTHTCTRAQATCAEIGNSGPMGCIRL